MRADVIPSPNIWDDADTYELENLGVDRAGRIERAMRGVLGREGWERADWAGLEVLDIGCGSGFHLPRFAATALGVVGVEPHSPLVALARTRVSALPNVRVVHATAADTTLPAASVDIAHARWAYFFGPGCEPGLAELDRVMRPGGVAYVIDNDATRSTFGGWFREAQPSYDARAVERFWTRHGWSRIPLDIAWELDTPEQFERVLRIELAPELCDRILAADPGRVGVDYAVNLWWRQWPKA